MSGELWLWGMGLMLAVLGFWLRDWKERVEEALAVKQKELDLLEDGYHKLSVQMERRITRDELATFRVEMKTDIREAVQSAFARANE